MMNKNKLIFLAFGVSSSMIFSSCNNTTLSNTAKDASANESNEELELPGDGIYYDKDQYKNDGIPANDIELIDDTKALDNEYLDSSWKYSNDIKPEEKILRSLNEKYDFNISAEDIKIACVSLADYETVFEAGVYVQEFDDTFLAVWFDGRKQICDDYPGLYYCEKINEHMSLIQNYEAKPEIIDEVNIHIGKTFDNYVGYEEGFEDYLKESDTFYKVKLSSDISYLTNINIDDLINYFEYIQSLGYKYYIIYTINDIEYTFESDKSNISLNEFFNSISK